MKRLAALLIGTLLLGISVAARPISIQSLSPQDLSDLRVVVTVANKVKTENSNLFHGEVILSGLYKIRHRCARALSDEERVIEFNARIKQELATHPGRGVYTPPVQARRYRSRFFAALALKKSIHSKLVEIESALPNQAIVTTFLDPQHTLKLENGPWAAIQSELSGLSLQEPNRLIRNATVFLNEIDSATDGSPKGYLRCVELADSIGIRGGQ